MALIRLDHVPKTLKVNLPLNIILPDPGQMDNLPVRQRKVLYLLHGLGDDASSWQRYSAIETTASAYGLVVVMPSAGRSFYVDQPNGQRFFSYLVEELPRYLEDVFSLTPQRENTLIAGVSMGGYGAFKAALFHPDRFYVAASFSGFLSLAFLNLYPDDPRLDEFAYLFGDLRMLQGSLHDPMVWLKNAAANPAVLPRLYLACGRQDDLYPLNRLFQTECHNLGINLKYHEEDAGHDWPFWDAQIGKFLGAVLGPPAA